MGRSLVADALRGVYVLVVDDEPDSLDIVRTILEYSGALVTTAPSGDTALAVLTRVIPDALVVDIEMPMLDGYGLLGQIRASTEAVRDAPAIAITAYGSLHPVERTLQAGFQAHVAKPIDPWQLVDTLQRLLPH